MKRLAGIFLTACLLAATAAFAQVQQGSVVIAPQHGSAPAPRPASQPDSAVLRRLDARLAEYFKTLTAEPVVVKNRECDFLVENTPAGPLRDHVAWQIYDFYVQSPLMGDEGVAVHVADAWILTGKVGGRSEIDRMNARIFADFNRQSLLGMPAPGLVLAVPSVPADVNGPVGIHTEAGGNPPAGSRADAGNKRSVGSRADPGTGRMPPIRDPGGLADSLRIGGPSDRYRVLFFYDTGCAKCKFEVVRLMDLLNTRDYPIDLYAVYTGGDAAAWAAWRSGHMPLTAAEPRLFHGWDPECKSDFQRKYGVLQTPRIFLLDKAGVIVGRGLDTPALQQLLDRALVPEVYDYAGPGISKLFDTLFAGARDTLTVAGVLSTAALVERRTLGRGDTLGFKHLAGGLLYWLSGRREEAFRNATGPYIQEYVLSRPGIWNTSDDSLRVVGMAEIMRDLVSRTPVGSRLPKLPLPGWNKLRRRGGYVLFYTEGCNLCQAELAAADSLQHIPGTAGSFRFPGAAPSAVSSRKILFSTRARGVPRPPYIVRVNMDRLLSDRPDLADRLFSTFDLTVLPNVLQVDRQGRVRRKYMSFAKF